MNAFTADPDYRADLAERRHTITVEPVTDTMRREVYGVPEQARLVVAERHSGRLGKLCTYDCKLGRDLFPDLTIEQVAAQIAHVYGAEYVSTPTAPQAVAL